MAREEALAALRGSFDELLPLLYAAYRVRAARRGRTVQVNVILNARSGACSEDCSYCSQSSRAETDVPRYPLEERRGDRRGGRARGGGRRRHLLRRHEHARAPRGGTSRRSARRPARSSAGSRCGSAPRSACSPDDDARTLAAAGVDRYNHNLETSRAHYPSICTHAHLRRPRGDDPGRARRGHGGLLRRDPRPRRERRRPRGPRLRAAGARGGLDPGELPRSAPRHRPAPTGRGSLPRSAFAGSPWSASRTRGRSTSAWPAGREAGLGPLQPLALFAANSLFANGYLTTPGQGLDADLAMIRAAGFTPEIHPE